MSPDNRPGNGKKVNGSGGPPKGLSLKVTEGGMAARISGSVALGVDRLEIQNKINSLLESKGVKFGVSSQDMSSVVEALAMGQELTGAVVARGTEPKPGKDARLELLVDIQSLSRQANNDDVKVDVRDRGPLPLVEPNTPLARLYPAAKGEPGKDVFNKIIPPAHSKLLKLVAGQGVELQEGGNLAVASVRGMVSLPEEDKIEVLEILEIDGDVDFAQGHIDFPGVVRIHGAILPDFKVKCENLEVETLEPGAMAAVSGDLVVHGGILRAAVKVGGDVTATYVRQARMVCGGDLTIENELLQSRVQCGGAIAITSGTGRIVNSHLEAVRGVSTTDIVSTGKGGTVISLGVSQAFLNMIASARRAIETYRKERRELEARIADQREELDGIEKELLSTLTLLKDPSETANFENLKAQIGMIKPLRESLKAEVAEGERKAEELLYLQQRNQARLLEMESVLPTGAVWLDVRGTADASTEIRGPNSSTVLDQSKKAFSIREMEVKDQETDQMKVIMRATKLRESVR